MKKNVCLLVIISFTLQLACAQQLTVGSYNIRYENTSDAKEGNGWATRCPVICQLIQFNDFDIFGAQEVLHGQLNDLLGGLPGYGSVGVGRDDGQTKGEYAPIFYKRDKYKVLRSGHFWLSENTDYPNKGWDAVLPRICTWIEVQDKKMKNKLWFFNLHMDHVGVKAREESSRLVLRKIKEMCGKDPVVLTGDFNVDQTNDNYQIIVSTGILNDCYEKAQLRYALNGTFNAFNTNLKTNSRIDHIFVSPQFVVERYGVLTDTYRSEKEDGATVQSGNFPKEVSLKEYIARIPSDHFPVKVVLSTGSRK